MADRMMCMVRLDLPNRYCILCVTTQCASSFGNIWSCWSRERKSEYHAKASIEDQSSSYAVKKESSRPLDQHSLVFASQLGSYPNSQLYGMERFSTCCKLHRHYLWTALASIDTSQVSKPSSRPTDLSVPISTGCLSIRPHRHSIRQFWEGTWHLEAGAQCNDLF